MSACDSDKSKVLQSLSDDKDQFSAMEVKTLGGEPAVSVIGEQPILENLPSTTSTRLKKPTEYGREYSRTLLLDQFNGWIRKFDAKLKRLNQTKVTCDQPHELRSQTKDLHDTFEKMKVCFERLRSCLDETEITDVEGKLLIRDKLCQTVNEDIAEIIKNLSLELRSERSSGTSRDSRSKASYKSKISQLGDERIQQAGKAAALEAELEYEKKERELENKLKEIRKGKQIASLHAQVKATKKAEAEELKNLQSNVILAPEESWQEKEQRILFSMDDKSSIDGCVEEVAGETKGKDEVIKRMQAKEVLKEGNSEANRRASEFGETSAMLATQNNGSSKGLVTATYHIPQVKMEVFEGSVVRFPAWESAFDALIGNRVQCSKHKMNLLGQYLSGEPKDLISGLLLYQNEEAYTVARQRLRSRYGSPSIVGQAFIDKLASWPKIGNNQPSDLQHFSDFLVQVMEVKRNIKGLEILDFAPESTKVVQKLPLYLQHKWRERVLSWKRNSNTYPPFEELVYFVELYSEEANIPELKCLSGSSSYRSQSSVRRETKSSRTLATNTRQKEFFATDNQVCAYCTERHHIDRCDKIWEIPKEERLQFLKDKGLCFACGSSTSHRSRSCDNRIKCQTCQKRHLSFLHEERHEGQQDSTADQAHSLCTEVCKQHNEGYGCDNSMIVPVWVRSAQESSREVLCYCILDGQSNSCFMSEDLKFQLGVTGHQTNLTLSTIYKSNAIITSNRIENLEVLSYDRKNRIVLPAVFTRNRIPATRSQIPTPEVAQAWKHLSSIQHNITPYQVKAKVSLLIGNNVPSAIRPREIVAGGEDEPYAQRSILGWGLVGMVCRDPPEVKNRMVVHRIQAGSALPPCLSENGRWMEFRDDKDQTPAKFIFTTRVKEVISPVSVRKMMEVDFVEGNGQAKELPIEDRRFIEILSENIYQQEDGHYVMPLPIRSSHVFLPNNRPLAVKRALQLKKRLEHNAQFKRDYVEYMEDIVKNYAERVPEKELNESKAIVGRINYVPHTGVYHSKRPTKIHVVFDCSAPYQNVSLNDHLLSGPSLVNELIGIICRFRKEEVAVMMDIKAMFHQFLVRERDRNLLRFLWWEEGDTRKPFVEFRMKVHLFGATSSPGCANFGLKRAADDGETEFGRKIADYVREDFYVDDGITSLPTVEEAISLVKGSMALCAKAGLDLHKFISNKREVLLAIPELKRAEGLQSLDLSVDTLPVERALGVDWCVENDCFQF